jgi:uncharacterized protein (TIGR00730 family)
MSSTSKTEQNAWRMFRIMGEFVAGFQQLSELPKAVTIFGSARTKPSDPYYKAAEEIAQLAVARGFPVISGGGPGIMEAANKGAYEAKGQSVGLCIRLPHEQSGNRFINVRVDFHYFFVRKVMFLKHTCAVVVMPGGFGTLDELFECATLVQTRKITPIPIILYGKSYWSGLLSWIRHQMEHEHHYVSPGDLDLLHLVDSPKEAAAALSHIQVEMPDPVPMLAPMD